MGIGYYHFHKDKFYNKVDNPSTSGDSVFPFIGSRFNYSPIPMGPEVPVFRSFLSEPNASGYIPKSSAGNIGNDVAFGQAQITSLNYGPINSIYEITIAGIQNSGTNCADCNLLNGTYYVKYRFNVGSTNEGRSIDSAAENGNYWYGEICDDSISRRYRKCSMAQQINLSLYKHDGGANYSKIWSSGQYAANVKILGTAFNTIASYINIFGSGNNIGRKYLLEESFSLTPAISGLNSTLFHTMETGVRVCDYSQSTCIVRPYRNGLFDIKNTTNDQSTHKQWPFIFAGHYVGGDVILPDSSGHTHKVPKYFDVTFSGVPNVITYNSSGIPITVAYSSCIPCNEYFGQTFRLKGNDTFTLTSSPNYVDMSDLDGIHQAYGWRQERPYPYYQDYMNISDYGCDPANYKGSDPAICFRGMHLNIKGDGFAELLIDSLLTANGSLTNYTSTIKLSKYIGPPISGNLCNPSLFDSTGWDYSLSGTVTPTTFPISSLCNFSGIVPIISPICESGTCECVYTGNCKPLCDNLTHPTTIIMSFTIPAEGVERNVAYTINNNSPLIFYGSRNQQLSIGCPNGIGSSYQLPVFVAATGIDCFIGGHSAGSGQYVLFNTWYPSIRYQDRQSFDCSTNVILGSGSIGYYVGQEFLNPPCSTEIFPITFTLQDYV